MAKEPTSISELNSLQALNDDEIIVFDTETTGLDPDKDEVLSLAIVDGDGNKLFYHLFKPQHRKRWPNATAIHGITWPDVKDESEIYYYEDELKRIFEKAKVLVGYNVEFDELMLSASGARLNIKRRDYCLMKEYAKIYGKYSEWKGENLWVKLTECAKKYGYRFEAHNALEDAKATAYCFKMFINDKKYYDYVLQKEKGAIQKAKEAKERERIAAAAVAEVDKKTLLHARIAKLSAATILFFFAYLTTNIPLLCSIFFCGSMWLIFRTVRPKQK